MNKRHLKNYILAQELDKIGQTDLSYTDYLCGTGRACDQILDIGDESQANMQNEISSQLATHRQIKKKNIELIQQISFDKTSKIELGAIVETNHVYLIIATSIAPFQYENKQFVGVSISAPLFKCLKGKTKGEECVYNGTTFLIKNIY